MKPMRMVIWAFLALAVPAAANHEEGCVPGAADPSTYNMVELPTGEIIYVEESGNPLGTNPPVPLSGFMFGDGTWTYQEANGLEGLQRDETDESIGTLILDVWCMIGCVIIEPDPVIDPDCGHGSDDLIF